MKKINSIILLAVLFFPLNNVQAQIKITPKAGLNIANMKLEGGGRTISSDNIIGYHAGVSIEFTQSERVALETGVFASTKGYEKKTSDILFMTDYESGYDLFYIDIPVNAKVNYELGEVNVFGLAGPIVGIGILGDNIQKTSNRGMTTNNTSDVDWGTDQENDDLKRIDYGLLLGAGANYNNFLLSTTYEYGLANISAYTGEQVSLKNRVLKFSVGYIISGNDNK